MKKLLVHPNKNYLMYEDGTPFFYLADTAWELFHALNREEADLYLQTRAKQGFNTVQAVALAEFDGLRTPNAYGRFPLQQENGVYDPTKPDLGEGYNYWEHVDFIISRAEELGLYIALLPTWGDKYNLKWGIGPEIFTPENAYLYAKWIANRYQDKTNIIWVLGGDRPLENEAHVQIIDAMGRGIKEVDKNHLLTFHPRGESSSCDCVMSKDYLDFHATQTGHALKVYDSYTLVRRTKLAEEKPCLDMEPRYEDHPACFKPSYGYFWDASDVRMSAYWSLMEGVCGHTYGNHCIWSMSREVTPRFLYPWNEALQHEGANQMKYVKELRMARDYFSFRAAPELVLDDTSKMAHICAGRGDNYAYIYTPFGLPVRAYLEKLTEKPVRASWYNPRTGETNVFGLYPPIECVFVPPTSGKGQDWIIILDIIEE